MHRQFEWLADYLYRSSARKNAPATLSREDAWQKVAACESRIARWIWNHPFEDYPPDLEQPRHADILHRVELSRILSRVPKRSDRRKLLELFYDELAADAAK